MSGESLPLFGVILAGGSGTRFWPLSRSQYPKQVLRLLDPTRFAARVFTLRPGGEVAAELAATGVPVASLDIPGRLTSAAAAFAMLRAARLLRADGTDVVHGYQWRPALVGTIVGQLARVPLIVAGKRSLTAGDGSGRFAWRVMARRVSVSSASRDFRGTRACGASRGRSAFQRVKTSPGATPLTRMIGPSALAA